MRPLTGDETMTDTGMRKRDCMKYENEVGDGNEETEGQKNGV